MDSIPSLVNLHIRASDEQALERLQYANNLVNQLVFNYQTPYESKSGDIVVWFYGDITRIVRIDEEFLEQSQYAEMGIDDLMKENAKLKRGVE